MAVDMDRDAAALPVAVRLHRFAMRRDVLAQVLFLIALGIVFWIAVAIVHGNLSRLSLKSGYAFLFEPASFELGETLIPYQAGDTYLRAFAVGILNTLRVAVLGIVLSTLVGLVIALGQLSPSVVVARACRAYVETVRNVPLLMQLIFWHTFLTRGLPSVRQALSPAEGFYLTNRGLYLPAPLADPVHESMALALLAGLALGAGILAWQRRRESLPHAGWIAAAAVVLPPLAVYFAAGAPLAMSWPEKTGFNFTGGLAVSPEFVAVLLGLSMYVGAFNAEIIRGGIVAVAKGQTEAGLALGLSRHQIMRKIVLPQALRIIVPPMTNSYLNLTKESSLAVAIGYPEIVRVANVTLAETNQSIECITIIMAVYLTLSLLTAFPMNWVNRRVALEAR